MSLPTAYTPLETLLLFQALRFEGVNSHAVFNRISDQLKSLPVVREHPHYDPGRLSPDALRALYLWLLKEEVREDLDRQWEREKALQNGDASSNSRKRKAATPTLPTVHDASQHAHLIPQLVTRLYVRYREHAVREIREHETRYEALVRDIEDIEAGKWDERLSKRESGTQTPTPVLLDESRSQRDNGVDAAERGDSPGGKAFNPSKIDALINHATPEPPNGVGEHRRNSSNTTLPPLSQMAPESVVSGPSPAHQHAYNHAPSAHQAAYMPSHGHPIPGVVNSPNVQQSLSRPSSSPRPVLPPPTAMTLQPHSPSHHSPNPANQPPYHHQYPTQPQHQVPNQPTYAYPPGHPPNQPPPLTGAYQHSPYPDQRQPYPTAQQPQVPPGYPNYGANYPHQPYPPATQDSRMLAMQQQHPHSPAHHAPGHAGGYPAYAPHPATAPSTASKPPRADNSRMVSDIIAALATPPRQQQRKAVWKSEKRLPPITGGTPVPRPEIEPLSPLTSRTEPTGRATRSTRNRPSTFSEQAEETDGLSVPARSRARRKRERSPLSVVSSTADESARMTRSQSVSTTAGALPPSDDRPGSRGNVKAEPSTPAAFVEDTPDTTQEPASVGRMTRKRRGTLQSHQPPTKRKRHESSFGIPEHVEDYDDLETPPPRSNTVIATRNFHKLSATLMNDINSHKHASYFANPVRDRDAPGYSEIIKQPQNLKGIRAAISAGTRAIAAAATAGESPSVAETPGRNTYPATGEATLELERSEDVEPPKAIVNAGQLEKEVMRIFANAVMFNPGQDGLVGFTREMMEDVEAKIREWRGEAGGNGGGGEEEEVEEESGKGKRRRMA